jgi:hypothetical protein
LGALIGGIMLLDVTADLAPTRGAFNLQEPDGLWASVTHDYQESFSRLNP